MTLPEQLSNWPLAWNLARTAHFTLQHRALPFLAYAVTGKKRSPIPDQTEFVKYAYGQIYKLLKADAENIKNGIYPASVLKPESPIAHWKRTLDVFFDGVAVAKRRNQDANQDLAKEFSDVAEDVPEYYLRNFHFQTDGYFSEHSADIYEHQVEILFAGAADPMRRMIIPLIKKEIPGDGKGFHFLELGSGTGRLTKFMKLAYPKAQITLIEPSDAYLKKSQEQLREFTGIDYLHGFAENIPLKDQSFDLVYSCYLFHELPLSVRRKVLQESKRVLKPQGLLGFIDSLQLGDDPQMNWALEQFPKDFHEPFYTNYIKTPMEDLLREISSHELKSDLGFFSKALVTRI